MDVNEQTGAIKLNHPDKEPWELAETCSLDVADRGGITLEEVGAVLNLTRERIRQVETRTISKLADRADEFHLHAPGPVEHHEHGGYSPVSGGES